jgi:hypothetical protein
MSSRHKVQDATGVINHQTPDGILQIVQRAAPSNGVAGYAPGCLWQNVAGTAGSVLYVNQGTYTSATWLNIA